MSFLLQTEIIPLCLRIMESGTEISRTVAIFILQKVLLDDLGLTYICQTYERFYAVCTVLNNMVIQLSETPSIRILKHVIRCYLRLSDNARYATCVMSVVCNVNVIVEQGKRCVSVCQSHCVIQHLHKCSKMTRLLSAVLPSSC